MANACRSVVVVLAASALTACINPNICDGGPCPGGSTSDSGMPSSIAGGGQAATSRDAGRQASAGPTCAAPGTAPFINAAGSPMMAGNYAMAIAPGDFNSDGILDLALLSYSDATVTVLLGDGTGSFAPMGAPATTGTHPTSIVAGDFNQDGQLDVAVTNVGQATVSVLLGDGHGGLKTSPASPFPVGNYPQMVLAGDFNRDGRADLAVTNQGDGNVTVLLGDGNGGFTEAAGSPVAVGRQPGGIAINDFNGDGKLDLVVGNNDSNSISVLLGNGQGGFTPAPGSPVALNGFPGSVAVGDFNGDGHADLATADGLDNSMRVLLGDGHGGFANAPGSPWAVEQNLDSVTVGDFNADGNLDLILTFGPDQLRLLLGAGNGTFTQNDADPVIVGGGPGWLTTGDFNRDGMLDVAIVDRGSSYLSVLLNDCGTQLAAGAPEDAGSVPAACPSAQVDAGHPSGTCSPYWTEVTCPSGAICDLSGQCVPPAYAASDGVVQDCVTHLQWQQELPTAPCPQEGDAGTVSNDPSLCTWEDAAAYCEHLSLGGYSSGWRLPTINELFSLLDKADLPMLDPIAFPNTNADFYWSSTPAGGSDWDVSFLDGSVGFYATENLGGVRCVR